MTTPFHPEPGDETPTVVQLRPSRVNRSLWAAAVLCGTAAILVGLLVIAPILRDGNRNDELFNRRTECRARIVNAASAMNGFIISDFASMTLINRAGGDVTPGTKILEAHQVRAAQLAPLQASSVEICRANPDYALPAPPIPLPPLGSTP